MKEKLTAFWQESYDWQLLFDTGLSWGVNFLLALLFLWVGVRVARFVEHRLEALFARSSKFDKAVGVFLASLGRYAILVVTIIAVLDRFGFETASLVALVGALGLAIGLALQGTLANVAAGVMLLIFRPFTTGQFVEVAGYTGVVKSISLFVTALDTGDNIRIMIPNASIWGASIKNYNFHDIRRLDQFYDIGYGADMDLALKTVRDVLEQDGRVLKDPALLVAIGGLGESSVRVLVRAWCASNDYWDLNFALLKAVKEALDRAAIEIPYPSRTLYVKTEAAHGMGFEA